LGGSDIRARRVGFELQRLEFFRRSGCVRARRVACAPRVYAANKTKGPSAGPGPRYQGLSSNRTRRRNTRGIHTVPRDGAGSTQKAYASPNRAQAAFSWLCA
jgi:hypothetical protein